MVFLWNYNLFGAKRREFSGMIHWLTINNHPSKPQQPIQQPYVERTRCRLWLTKKNICTMVRMNHPSNGNPKVMNPEVKLDDHVLFMEKYPLLI